MYEIEAEPALETPGKIGNLDCLPKNSAGSKWSQLKKEICGLLQEKWGGGAAASLLSPYLSIMCTAVSHGSTAFNICLTELPSCFWSDPSSR